MTELGSNASRVVFITDDSCVMFVEISHIFMFKYSNIIIMVYYRVIYFS